MDFLKYIEHSSENLQFYLWYKDYEQRFANLPDGERNLSPEWTQAQEDAEAAQYRQLLKNKTLASEAKDILKKQNLDGDDDAVELNEKGNPFRDDASADKASLESASIKRPMSNHTSTKTGFSKTAESAFQEHGAKFQPCKLTCISFGKLNLPISPQLQSNPSARKCLASSPSTSPKELPASSTSLPANALPSSTPLR